MPDTTDTNDARLSSNGDASKFVVIFGVIVLGAIALLLLAAFVLTAMHAPVIITLDAAARLVAVFANVAVSFWCFAAFRAKKTRAFLYIAFASLSFAYSALFSLLLGVPPPATAWHVTHLGITLYYASVYAAYIVGIALYAYGIISIARDATKRV